MEINSRNYTQAFTGFKITHKTKKGATKVIDDITKDFFRKDYQQKAFRQQQQQTMTQYLQKEIIEPLKNVKAEVEYNDGRIFVRNADKTQTVEIDRSKKVQPFHPMEDNIVQYPIKGKQSYIQITYDTFASAVKAARSIIVYEPFLDLISAREIAKHFDALDAKKLAEKTVRSHPLSEPFTDLFMSEKELKKHFDTFNAKKLAENSAKSAYPKELEILADNLLRSLQE